MDRGSNPTILSVTFGVIQNYQNWSLAIQKARPTIQKTLGRNLVELHDLDPFPYQCVYVLHLVYIYNIYIHIRYIYIYT